MQVPQIDQKQYDIKRNRLKYMRKFYTNKLDVCEEKQRGLFEDLIETLNYTLDFMQECKEYIEQTASEGDDHES